MAHTVLHFFLGRKFDATITIFFGDRKLDTQKEIARVQKMIKNGMTVGMVDKQLFQQGVSDEKRIEFILAAIKRVNFQARLTGLLLAVGGVVLMLLGVLAFFQIVAVVGFGFKYLLVVAMFGLMLTVYGIYNMTHGKIVYSPDLKH